MASSKRFDDTIMYRCNLLSRKVRQLADAFVSIVCRLWPLIKILLKRRILSDKVTRSKGQWTINPFDKIIADPAAIPYLRYDIFFIIWILLFIRHPFASETRLSLIGLVAARNRSRVPRLYSELASVFANDYRAIAIVTVTRSAA